MKRACCLVLCLMLLACLPGVSVGEEAEASRFQFDLFFHLHPESFSGMDQARAEGYAELLSALELKGELTWAPDSQCVDTTFSLVPVTNPSAALTFRLFGYPSHLLLTSPLLGNETILFNSEALMEFCMKTYSHLQIPLPYLALLFPYSTFNAFYYMSEAWVREIGFPYHSMTIKAEWVRNLADAWSELLLEDNALLDWFGALSLQSDASETLSAELQAVPSYVLGPLTGGRDIQMIVEEDAVAFAKGRNEFYRETARPDRYAIETSLPVTASGFQPELTLETTKNEETAQTALHLSYASTPETLQAAGLDADPQTLLTLNASAALPVRWPVSGSYTAGASIEGDLLPPLRLKAHLEASPDGSLRLLIFDEARSAATSLLEIDGTLTSLPVETVPSFDKNWMIQFLNIFSVNDVTLQEFVHRVARPALYGVLDFLVEMPVAGCQSVMDDLSDSGILRLLLGE